MKFTRKSLQQSVGIISLCGVLLVSALTAAAIGVRGLCNALAENILSQWQNNRERTRADEDSIQFFLASSHQFNPANPSTSLKLGRFYELKAFDNSQDRQKNHEMALLSYRLASELRPASAISWAMIAEVKSRLGELDTEFEEALLRSVTLGPWEPQPQTVVVRAGLRHWTRLSSQTRQLVRDTAVRGMLSRALGQRNKMSEILKQQDSLSMVCPHLPNSDIFSPFCP